MVEWSSGRVVEWSSGGWWVVDLKSFEALWNRKEAEHELLCMIGEDELLWEQVDHNGKQPRSVSIMHEDLECGLDHGSVITTELGEGLIYILGLEYSL